MRTRPAFVALLALVSFSVSAQAPGLGFAYLPQSDGLRVTAVATDGPSLGAGLKANDIVTSVGGLSMAGAEREAIASWLQTVTARGQSVRIDIKRGDIGFSANVFPMPYNREELAAQDQPRSSADPPAFDPRAIDLLGFGSGLGFDFVGLLNPMERFAEAMNQPPENARASREGDALLVRTATCTTSIPITAATTIEPYPDRELILRINSRPIRVACTGSNPDPSRASVVFRFETKAARDEAVSAGRWALARWPAAQVLPQASQTPPAASGTGCVSGNCTAGIGTWHYSNGNTYSGTWREGNRHGRGTYTWATGNSYTGEWVDGARTHGATRYSNGDVYDGSFLNEKRHGQGTMTFADGRVESGTWRADALVAANAPARATPDMLTVTAPRCIAGNCENGRGTLLLPGVRFEGDFVDGMPHGNGTYTFDNGNVYVGEIRDAQMHGTGVFTDLDGTRYSGTWRANQRHGRGTVTISNGETFTGDWVGDARVRGRETLANGNVYDGEYAENKFHGQGTMAFADGAVYTGSWRAGIKSGQGRYTWPSGSTFSGEFVAGSRVRGVNRYASGDVYDGAFQSDNRHGQGTMTYADGRVFVGMWSEDNPVSGTLQAPGGQPRPVRVEAGDFVFTD